MYLASDSTLHTMKQIVLLLLLALGSQSVNAQHELFLDMTHLFGGDAYDEDVAFTSPQGESVMFERMEYYLCNFVITHDGGVETTLDDVYVLVNAHENGSYSLGSWGIGSVESMQFSVGVDEPNNHEDPALWDASHPLAPQLPSMHWGWASGYRFVAYEGTANGNNVEIHALGDDNFFSQNHDISADLIDSEIHIDLFADYANMYDGVAVGNGVIEHGEVGLSIPFLENFRDHVFSTDATVGLEAAVTPEFALYPNPVKETLFFSGGEGHSVSLMDLSGRTVGQVAGIQGKAQLKVADLPAGVYLARVEQNGQVVRTERIVIQ